MEQLDGFDLKILSDLQGDGQLTNNELSERIAFRRRNARAGARGWRRRAIIRPTRRSSTGRSWGSTCMVVISVTLATHNRDNAQRFGKLICRPCRRCWRLRADRRDGLSPEGGDAGSRRPFALRQRRALAA